MVYLTLTGRNDWASQLAYTSTSSFFYPSAGISTILSEMINMPDWFTFAKARFSYSSVGSSFDRYLTLYYWTYDSAREPHYQGSPNHEFYDLKPERTNSLEVGLNLRFLRNMFNLDVTYYKSNTRNQTFFVELPASAAWDYAPVQTGNIQNSGVELAVGYSNKWGHFGWDSNFTYTFNDNKIKRLANGAINPVTGEVIDMPYLQGATLGDQGGPTVRLVEGGSMGDIYVNRALQRDGNGNIFLDSSTMLPQVTEIEPTKVGSLLAKSYMGWSNNLSWKGIDLNFIISARIGGNVVSGTQAIMDRYGVSKASADLRDKGLYINENPVDVRAYYNVIAAGTGVGAHYVYSTTNVRLQEVSLGYTIPPKVFNNVMTMTVSVVGRNLWMIYNRAPFDPELSPSTTSTFYSGIDYFMMPSLRNLGFSVKLRF
ncbi:MAG: TonB-dependent receptor [Alistipes sp.]|nr:TonB-dependent receptor [Alistipes sp.]